MIKSISLYCREGNSDKVYNIEIKEVDSKYVVNFSYGKRGAALNTGTKTNAPVDLESASKIFDKLVREKKANHYKELDDNEGGVAICEPVEKIDSGIRCQLLVDIDEETAIKLIEDDDYLMEEKHDGRRIQISRVAGQTKAINKLGFYVPVPVAISGIDFKNENFRIDCEDMGSHLFTFDILHRDGISLEPCPLWLTRKNELRELLRELNTDKIKYSQVFIGKSSKAEAYDRLKEQGAEGVIFKLKDAPFMAGKPASGATQFKRKFYETASFIVGKINDKRSVGLQLYEGDKLVPAGNVTIPGNAPIPSVGEIVEVRYLYAYKESGSVYQPVFIIKRDDVLPEECTTSQLKYKK